MSALRRQGKRPKGVHLTLDVCEMLNQLCIIDDPVESFHVNQAVMDYFAKKKAFYRELHGADYWDRCLESVGHQDKFKTRRGPFKI